MQPTTSTSRSPWAWIPTLYIAEGIPYVVINEVSTVMYKRMGIPNDEIAFYTSLIYLPWIIKSLWGPIVDNLKTKRAWIFGTQLFLSLSFVALAAVLPGSDFFRVSLAIFWLMAFGSATHDIAADGFYILGLSDQQQAFFVGIRSTFYKVASLVGKGPLVILAGYLEHQSVAGFGGSVTGAWTVTAVLLGFLFLLLAVYHKIILPSPASDRARVNTEFLKEFFRTFSSFLKKDRIALILGFLLLYRLGEAQLVKLVAPFLLDGREVGGLGLSTEELGFIYGTLGTIALTIGGLAGGFVVSRKGLRYWLWPMVLIIHLPDLVFVYFSAAQPDSLMIIGVGVALEQFGYGFGFQAYMMYMLYVSRGEHSTAHYAICTSFMALGMAVPQALSGLIQQQLGYTNFFIWVFLATIPSFILVRKIDVDPGFGKKRA